MDFDSAPQFGLTANFHIPGVCNFDFMAIINLRIYMGFDRRNLSGGGGGTSHPSSLFTVISVINFQICYPHKIKIANTKIMKFCN